jgi:hypothetical protein
MNPYYLLKFVFGLDQWCVEVRNTNSGGTSFFYFPTYKAALNTYPEAKTAAHLGVLV